MTVAVREKVGTVAAIRILVMDGHPVLCRGIAALLSAHPGFEVVGECHDGTRLAELYRRRQPDVVLTDLHLPDGGGAAALRALRESFPASRVVLFTACDTDEDIYAAVRAGAMAFVPRDAPLEALLDAIRSAHAGCRHLPPGVAAKLAGRVATDDLTGREREVLREIACGRTNQEIARELFITESTVKFHVNRILSKLGCQDRTQALVTGVRRGLVRIR